MEGVETVVAVTAAGPPPRRAGPVIARVLAGFAGSYGFVWGLVSLGTATGVLLGLSYADAQTLFQLLAFLVYVVCFCWAFSAKSVLRVWSVFVGCGSVMTTVGWLVSRTLT